MADVTGPISTLPGAYHAVPAGMMCDAHADRPAVARIQGETDSMGAELIDCCAECRDEMTSEDDAVFSGQCDWCQHHSTRLQHRRDFEEGSSGPVYEVCDACRDQADARIAAELRSADDQPVTADYDDWDDPSWHDAEDGLEREYVDEDEDVIPDDD